MIIDAEFTVKIKLPNMPLSNNVSGLELRQRIMEEEKRDSDIILQVIC